VCSVGPFLASFLIFAGEFGDDGIPGCSTTELHGATPWQESNLRPADYEATLVFTTGEFDSFLIAGEQAMR